MCFSSSGRPLNRKIITGRVEWNSPNEWHCSVIFHRTFTRIFGIIFLKNSNNTEHYVNFTRTKWRNSSTCPLIRLNRPVVSSRWRWNMQRFIGRENFSTREDVALSGGRSSWLFGREETRDAGRWRPTTALRAQHSICCFHSALHLNGLNWFIEIFHVTRSLHISGWWANKRRVSFHFSHVKQTTPNTKHVVDQTNVAAFIFIRCHCPPWDGLLHSVATVSFESNSNCRFCDVQAKHF